jgi:thiol-disulfide isomerase/thioredoxin
VTGLVGVVLALVLLVTGCGSSTSPTPDAGASEARQGSNDEGVTSGGGSTDVPALLDFTAETLGGERFAGADLAGKPTVLWFWAPWCPTCRAQVAGVGDLAADHGADVNVVGVGALDEREAIEEFAADVSSDVTLLADPEGSVWRHFEVTAQSTYVVLDAKGDPVASGYLDDAELADLVADLVG